MAKLSNTLHSQLRITFYIVLLLTVVEIINLFTGRFLNQFSILPRNVYTFPYVFTAPFLHANLQHFIANIVPLSLFVFLTLQFGKYRFIKVTFSLIVFTGLLVWLFGRNAYHIGASGIIYGYFGYLLLAGFLSKKIGLLIISVGVAFFYGAMIWGVLPYNSYVSWESHLFGFIVGIIIALRYK